MTRQPPPEVARHVSDSVVQRRAEDVMCDLLGRRIGVDLAQRTFALAAGGSVQVDAVGGEPLVLAEIFARHGTLKAGQKKKVAIDAFKLITVQREYPDARLVLCFADAEAARYATGTGWLAHALRSWGIAVEIVDLSDGLRAEIVAAQAAQTMVNPD